MNSQLKNGSVLKNVFESIKDLVDQGTFICSKRGVEFKTLDSSHIVYIHISMKKGGFEKFSCEKENGETTFSADITTMIKVLKWIKGGEELEWNVTEDKMEFVIGEDKAKKFNLRLIDLEYEELEISEIDYDCKLTMSTSDFSTTFKDLSLFSDDVMIKTNDDNELVLSVSGIIGDGSVIIKNDCSTTIDIKDSFNLKYSLPYILNFTKASSLADNVTIYFSNNSPAIFEYKIEKYGFLKFYLAPKDSDVDSDDEDYL